MVKFGKLCDKGAIILKAVRIDIERLKGALSRRQTEVANKIGLTLNTLSRKLNGRVKFSLEDLNKVCLAISREPAEFLIFEEVEGIAT